MKYLLLSIILISTSANATNCFNNRDCSTDCFISDVGICIKQGFETQGYCVCVPKTIGRNISEEITEEDKKDLDELVDSL